MTEEIEAEPSVIKDRYKKLDEIRKKGINPYPYSFGNGASAK
jgi:lysyl-tRNA synthetase class II